MYDEILLHPFYILHFTPYLLKQVKGGVNK